MEPFAWTVGIDQGPGEHFVVVMDSEGAVVGEHRFVHDGQGLLDLADWVEERIDGAWARTAIGSETPWGSVMDTLMQRGASAFSINPKQLDRLRDRFSVAGSKDDRRDAFVVTHGLRNDAHLFRPVRRPDSARLQLRELGRLRDQLHRDRVRATNQLHALLSQTWPSLLKLSPGADERWLWSLLERAPLPQQARRLRPKTLEKLLREHRIRRFDVEHLQEVLREPLLELAPGLEKVMAYQLAVWLPRLRLLDQQCRQVEADLNQLLKAEKQCGGDEPSDAAILASHPGIGTLTAAALLGEAGDELREYRHLRALAGVAPVSKISGRKRIVHRRYACNPRLARTVHLWVEAARKNYPEIQTRYARLRARGHTHGRALRQLGDALLRTLAATLRNRTLYEATYRRELPHTH